MNELCLCKGHATHNRTGKAAFFKINDTFDHTGN
jgi:hypothetical protein